MKSATVADLGGGFLAWPLTCSPRALRQYWPRARQEDSPRPRTAPSQPSSPVRLAPWLSGILLILDYPRVRGVSPGCCLIRRDMVGLSPHLRGNLVVGGPYGVTIRSIPAWAGEPPGARRSSSEMKVYPRVGGGTFIAPTSYCQKGGLSPRGRGNLQGRGGQALR